MKGGNSSLIFLRLASLLQRLQNRGGDDDTQYMREDEHSTTSLFQDCIKASERALEISLLFFDG